MLAYRSGVPLAGVWLEVDADRSTSSASAGDDGVHRRCVQLPAAPDRPGILRTPSACLGSLAHGDGPTLQDAADDLVQRLLSYAMALRASGIWPARELGPLDLSAIDFLYQLGEIAAAGGDIRSHVFG
jgi:hypothetical protein